MFKEVDSNLEQEIVASTPKRKSKTPDYSIRTVSYWIHLQHHFGFCTIPTHYDNVPDADFKGEKYDKYPTRMCITIGPYEVCRWCYVAEADIHATIEGLPPVERETCD